MMDELLSGLLLSIADNGLCLCLSFLLSIRYNLCCLGMCICQAVFVLSFKRSGFILGFPGFTNLFISQIFSLLQDIVDRIK